jgi:Tol biopolymer transport system component/predicted Ser/Thr protein kinase
MGPPPQPAPASSRDDEPPSPAPRGLRTVGRYEILGEISRGGMGIVYRARDLTLDRVVALKTPRPEQSSADDRRRFLREAQAVARLSDSHIVPVFEVFESEDTLWVAMEFVEGQTFRTLLRERGRLPPGDVVQYAEGLARALRAAHATGLLHRDVNPNNIMLGRDGRARLMDFGLALAFAPPDATTSARGSPAQMVSNPGAGTPAYMPPEQILGQAVDVRSDIFSFGVVLYELCTGHHPFPARAGEGLYEAILNRDPLSPSRLEPSVPPELERIITKALAKQADARYQTAADLAADLSALRRQMDKDTVPARVVRHGWRRLAIAGGVLAAGGGLAGPTWMLMIRPDALPVAKPVQVTSFSGWEAEPSISPDGRSIAFTSDESGNSDIWVSDVHGGGTLRLTSDPAADRQPAWFPDGSTIAFVSSRRGRSDIWAVPRFGGSPTLIVEHAEEPAISPDATRIAFVRAGPGGQRRVHVAALADPSRTILTTKDGEGLWDHAGPAWSPDGTRLCYSAARDLWVIPAGGGAASRLTTDDEADSDPAWAHDGRHVLFSSYRDGTMAVWRVPAAGGRPARLTGGTGPERHPSASRDGATLVYTTFAVDSDLVVRDLESGEERIVGSALEEQAPVFAPDGSAVAFVSNRTAGRYDVWLQGLDGGVPTGPARRLTDQPGSVAQPSYSPDGRWIAYHRVLDGQRDVWVVSSGGGIPVQFTDHPAVDLHPEWSPDGRQMAFVSERSGGSHIWVAPVRDGRPAGPARQLTFGPTDDEAPCWSPDGAWVAFIGHTSGDDAEVWVQRAAGDRRARRLTTGAQAARVRWNRASTGLIVSGLWGREALTLQRVSLDGADVAAFDPSIDFGVNRALGHFDVSRDGRLLVFARSSARGDIWMMSARPGSF